MKCRVLIGTPSVQCENEAGEWGTCDAHTLQEGDVITLPHVMGFYPDGQFIVDKTAPKESAAKWKVGHRHSDGSQPVTMLKPGQRFNEGKGQRPAGWRIG